MSRVKLFYPVFFGVNVLLVFLFCGCQPAVMLPESEQPSAPLIFGTVTVTPFLPQQSIYTETPFLTPTAIETATATETPVCTSGGTITAHQVTSSLIPIPIDVNVYLPPCYEQNSQPASLLILLHGQTHTEYLWSDMGVQQIADDLILSGAATPMIIAMPNELYYLQDPSISWFESAVVDVVIPWLEENFNVCMDSSCRGIGGISRGGAWAIRIVMNHPDMFSALGGHSPVPFGNAVYQIPYWLEDLGEQSPPELYLDIGDQDGYYQYAYAFHAGLEEYGVSHEWIVPSGGHSQAYWAAHLSEWLTWYGEVLSH